MPDIHATLSASSSHRWLNCTPSIRLEKESGIPDSGSVYAAEGTLAHELAEVTLLHLFGRIDSKEHRGRITKIQGDENYSEEMKEYIADYVKYVCDEANKALEIDKDAFIGFEERLDYSPWARKGFGTGDVVIICNGQIEIVDLKYGKGVPVDAKDNPQMKLYALGAYNAFGFIYDDIKKVKVTIVQPRINHTNSWETTVTEILNWGEEIVKPKAEMAYDGKGDAVSGDWCKFCRAKPVCRAYNAAQLQIAQYDFKEPELLTDDEVADVLRQCDEIASWASAIKEYAQKKAISEGTRFNGFKLVEGRSNRKITDVEKVEAILVDQGGFDRDDLYEEPKMLGITKLEKLVGKKKLTELAGQFIVKPDGAPTLVSEDDKRKEWAPAESVFKPL